MDRESRARFEHDHDLALRKRQFSAINVENLTDADLEECIAHPAIHGEVKRCAELTRAARAERLAGRIDTALRIEAKVQRTYETLPKALRW